ncbi:hypothetical protein GCM10009858_00670 [Terrabacter carboxydivorans]|uniref:Uncharacterized protein n=1 Tax=Terrabacter carboxydivorans TaxID=619730 RepID=A0ABN3KR01_9MICO
MASPIHTGRKRSSVDSLATTGSWSDGTGGVDVTEGLLGWFTGVLRTLGIVVAAASTMVDTPTLAATSACVNMDHRRCR